MPSRYDASKNCRVGTMDERQFYSEADKENGSYFRTLLGAWTKAGGSLKWGAGGSHAATRKGTVKLSSMRAPVATVSHALPRSICNSAFRVSSGPRGPIWAVILSTPRLSVYCVPITGPKARSSWRATFDPSTRHSLNQ